MSDLALHIEITQDNLCKIIMDDNGIKINKFMTVDKFATILNDALKEEKDKVEDKTGEISEIFVNDNIITTLQTKRFDNGSCWYMLLRNNVPANFIFKDVLYKNIGMPYTLFAIKVFQNKFIRMNICCTKTRYIDNNTKLYCYPFSNVSSSGSVCLGGNNLSCYDLSNFNNIKNIPEMFLMMPNSSHSYGNNNSGKEYIDLLESLKNNDFNNDYLKEMPVSYMDNNINTYGNFVKKIY